MSHFFELIQISVGNRATFSATPTTKQWHEMYEQARTHSLSGILFAALERMPKDQLPDRQTLMKWYMLTNKIKERNPIMTRACTTVTDMFRKDGFESCILKGQGNLSNYIIHATDGTLNIGDYRQSGDIDIWVWPSKSLMQSIGQKSHSTTAFRWPVSIELSKEIIIDYIWQRYGYQQVEYHHMVTPMLKGVMVETHFMPSVFVNPFTQRRAVKWFEKNRDSRLLTPEGFYVPTPSFNVVYQLMHIYRHLILQGIGLRQMMDYYFTVMSLHHNTHDASPVAGVMKDIHHLRMTKIMSAVMYVMREVFGMKEEYLLCPPSEKYGKKLLHELLDVKGLLKTQQSLSNGNHTGFTHHLLHFWQKNRIGYRHVLSYPSESLWTLYLHLRMSLDTRTHTNNNA